MVLFCHITTQVKTDPHQNLLQEKGGDGFPYLIYMNAEGRVQAKVDWPLTIDNFKKAGQKADDFAKLREKAEKGDKAAKIEVFETDLGFGNFTSEEGWKKYKEFKELAKEKKEQLEAGLTNLSVREVMSTVTKEKATQLAAGKKFLEMKKAGKPAPTGEMETQYYWILMMDYCEDQKDAASFEEALKALKAKFGDKEEAKQFFDAKDEILKKLKEGKDK